MNIGQTIDKLFLLREQKLKQSDKVKEIQKEFDGLQAELLLTMEAQGLQKAAGENATATVGLGFYPAVDELEIFIKWVVKNKKFEMLQKRVSAPAVKEMLDTKNQLPPGVKSHTEPKLNLRRK